MLKKCLVCKKEFNIRPAMIKRGFGKYCSKKCGGIARTTSKFIKCKICGKKFKVEKSRLKKGKYCSVKCNGIDRRGKPSGMSGKKQSNYFFKVMNGKEPWNKGTVGVMKKNSTSFKKGQKAWNKGIPFSDKVRKKMSANKQNEKNHGWKGDKAKYGTKHDWVRTRMGKAREHVCEICKRVQANEWSNKDHKYKRDLKDWQAVCKKCHYEYDKKHNNK